MTDATSASPVRVPVVGVEAAVRRLDAGNARFVSGELDHPRRDDAHRAALQKDQQPFAAVLGCSDSRVPLEIVFDEGVGDLFAVRVAGNTAADAVVVGSLEFAVAMLGVAAVVVVGHEGCGAVRAAIDVVRDGARLPGELMAVVAPIVPIVASVLASAPTSATDTELLDTCVRANITHVTERLSRVDLLADAISGGTLTVVGREYRLRTGETLVV